jgi:RNA polymerase sigma factor (sigma-70 family)
MAIGDRGIALRQLNTLFSVGAIGGLTDLQLLERFTCHRDETAFQALVERHGPMVLRVCRAVLRDPADADDAFQATFLVLVRRAGSLWVRESLGPWLFQVAGRTAARARLAAVRRRRYELRAAEMVARPPHEGECDDLVRLVHEEVSRLPERYRTAVVLCLLEGLTTEQAAQHLNCPVGTVHSRLARGREQLRRRLSRRGLAAPAGIWAVGCARKGASAAVPPALADSTIRAALRLAIGHVSAGAVPTSVAALTGMILRTMLMAKIRVTMATLLLVVGVVAVGGGVLSRQGPGDRKLREASQVKGAGPVNNIAPQRAESDKPAGAEAAKAPTASKALETAKAAIAANRSAVKSIVLTGKYHVAGKVTKVGTEPSNDVTMRPRKPFDARGTFEYKGDGFGGFKRWLKSTPDPMNVVGETRALNKGVVYDAQDPTRGYVRAAEEFLSERADNLEFYRDHWFTEIGLEPDDIMKLVKEKPSNWTTTVEPDGAITIATTDEPKWRVTATIDPKKAYMLRHVEGPSAIYVYDNDWEKDKASGVWYLACTRRIYRMIFPEGSHWEETIDLVVDKARFNEPIPEKDFTFRGLGLKVGSKVHDMSVSPPREYFFQPGDVAASDVALGIAPRAGAR